jgi:hypothetical protein
MTHRINRLLVSFVCFIVIGLSYVFAHKTQDDIQKFQGELPVGWRRAAEFVSQNLTEDQRYELKMFREIYKDDRVPPEFGKRYITAKQNAADTGLWMIEFIFTVTDDKVEKVAKKMADQYNMTIEPESIFKGPLVRSAIMKGHEENAERLSADSEVRRVQQDTKLKTTPEYKVGGGQRSEDVKRSLIMTKTLRAV